MKHLIRLYCSSHLIYPEVTLGSLLSKKMLFSYKFMPLKYISSQAKSVLRNQFVSMCKLIG
jgi:hypothetical protein